MGISPEELELLKDFEDEFGAEGSVPLPTGIFFHWRVTGDSEVAINERSGLPRAKIAYQVTCGPHEGRRWSDYVGWYSVNGNDKTKNARGFLSTVYVNALNFNDGDHDELHDAMRTLPRDLEPSSENIDIAKDGLNTVIEALEGMSIYAQIVENKKTGDKNIRYAAAKDSPECECN